jgi:DNA-binding response OmpR family regulator
MANNKKKILLIEDDKFLSEMYATKLTENGLEVETAFHGDEGMAKIEDFKPDLVLLDIVLPKKDGFEILRTIKKDGSLKDAVGIILTNLGQKEEVERGFNLGASDYIIKAHFTPTEVVTKVKKMLGI